MAAALAAQTRGARHLAPPRPAHRAACVHPSRRARPIPPGASSSDSSSSGGDTPGEVFQGIYGPWSITPDDELEVLTYRLGLSGCVGSFVAAVGLTAAQVHAADWTLNPLAALGAAALAVSLVQIHIYVDEVKRTLQLLALAGTAGGAYLALGHPDTPLPLLIAQQPWSIWLVGPAAAAVTGVAIKEGLCYGKLEAAGLAVLLPGACLAHLLSAPPALQSALLAGVCGVGAVFAARKYSQPVKDDIGDKSVFEFRKLPAEEQARRAAAMKQRLGQQQQQQQQRPGADEA